MPRRIPGLRRVLGAGSIASVAYGEIASSLYFALGVVALHALGLTPWVLLAVGALFLLVALSYAEGTAAIPETGGAATFVRRAFNDPAGFLTGWALFLDYLIVIALAALFTAHYLGDAVGWHRADGRGFLLRRSRRGLRLSGAPEPGRPGRLRDRPRDDVDSRAAARDRPRLPGTPLRRGGRRSPHLPRADRHADPDRGRDDGY